MRGVEDEELLDDVTLQVALGRALIERLVREGKTTGPRLRLNMTLTSPDVASFTHVVEHSIELRLRRIQPLVQR